MPTDPEQDFVAVNKILGKPASFGPIPTAQLLPWLAIVIICYTLTNGFFSFGMPWFFATSFWLCTTWWFLTGSSPHHFVDKFRQPPGYEWCNGNLLHLSILPRLRPPFLRRRYRDSTVKVKLPPITKKNQQSQNRNYMPFQNDLDLTYIVTINKGGRTCCAYLLNQGKQWQLVFGFRTQGLHNILSRQEVSNACDGFSEGLKELLPGEKLTIHTGCYSNDYQRQQELSSLADNCQLQPISILVRNEQKRLQELTLDGTRQVWGQMLFCTWTINEKTGFQAQDWIGKSLNFLIDNVYARFNKFTGTEQLHREQFLKQLLVKGFEQGFLRWELLLNTKLGLEIQPCSASELWHWVWDKFNAEGGQEGRRDESGGRRDKNVRMRAENGDIRDEGQGRQGGDTGIIGTQEFPNSPKSPLSPDSPNSPSLPLSQSPRPPVSHSPLSPDAPLSPPSPLSQKTPPSVLIPPSSEIPQQLILSETNSGYQLRSLSSSHKDIKTILIEGQQQGRGACPEHRGSKDSLWLVGRLSQCAVLTMESKPDGWQNQREQLRWLWSILSNSYVHDTEAVVELSIASDFLIQDNLARQAKQSKAARERAITKGQGRDVGAEVKAEESFEAQKKMYKGAKAINVAVTFLVYRPTTSQLDLACRTLAHSFGSAKVIRERNIAWAIWLETLPITTSWLLHSSSLLSERRLVFDTETVAGVMPLTITRDLNRQGVELIAHGGKPVHIDLVHQQVNRAIITGTSGSGKSVLAWRFIVDALAANIPVVGLDISSGGGSTFKTAVELLGDAGAYYDIRHQSSNLLEPPDLRRFDSAQRAVRLDQWKEFVRNALTSIAMGQVHDPKLAQRVDNLVLQTLERFLSDPDIIERYNLAFTKGWKSKEWQHIPVLADWLSFCSKEQLNMRSYEQIDALAINQIHSQVKALLISPLGKAIGKPSSFSPEPAIKFFALSGLSNEQDQYLMALNAQAACLRNALSSPKSLFVGDEISVLFQKNGFAQTIGELFAVGRKNGIACLLIAQDIDSIYNCSAGAQIMQNTVYRITGRLTANGAHAWVKLAGYPSEIINQNATERFLPRRSSLSSSWLVETNGRFWQCQFYPGEMTLAAVANNQDELMARERIMSQYPTTITGQMVGLRHFADEYTSAIRSGQSLTEVGTKNNSQYFQLIAS